MCCARVWNPQIEAVFQDVQNPLALYGIVVPNPKISHHIIALQQMISVCLHESSIAHDKSQGIAQREYLFILFGTCIAKCCYRLPFPIPMLRCNSQEGKCYRLLIEQIKDQTKQMTKQNEKETAHIYTNKPQTTHTQVSTYPLHSPHIRASNHHTTHSTHTYTDQQVELRLGNV